VPAKARIPISSYFSDYSSKLWDLSSGTEFNVGNSLESIYFKDGQPRICQNFFISDETTSNYGYHII
jgi:hypothetical protein